MIKWFKESSNSELAIVVFIAIAFLSATYFGLITKINEPDCHVVACQYKENIFPVLNFFGIVFFLPVSILLFLGIKNPFLILISFGLSVAWWLILGVVIDLSYFKITGKKRVMIKDLQADKIKFLFRFFSYFIFLFVIIFWFINFLFYPSISAEVSFDQFLLLATATVAISAYILNSYKGKTSEAIYFSNSIKKITILTVLLLVFGAFFSFMFAIRTVPLTENITDKATFSALQITLMGAGMLGLSSLLLLLMERISPKKLTREK